MNLAFRKIFAILVEKLIRLEAFYEEKMALEPDLSPDFFDSCRKSIEKIKEEMLNAKNELAGLSGEKSSNSDRSKLFLSSLNKIARQILDSGRMLSYLPSNQALPETLIFLDEALQKQIFLKNDSKIIFLVQDFLMKQEFKGFEKVAVFRAPVLESQNPLYWPLLLKDAFLNSEKFADVSALVGDFIEKQQLSKDETDFAKNIANELILDLFSVRLLGPAYFWSMIEFEIFKNIAEPEKETSLSLMARAELLKKELVRIELIGELNKFGESFAKLFNASENSEKLMEVLNQAFSVIGAELDKFIDKSGLFSKHDFEKSLISSERLAEGVLIASSPTCELDKIREEYEKIYDQSGESSISVYDFLNKLKETANTPQQILNAGWIYKKSLFGKIFFEELDFNNDIDFDDFGARIKQLDTLLIKSAETSSIHKVLLNEE